MTQIAFSSLSQQLPEKSGSVLLVPIGEFAASDGRPGNMDGVTCKKWVLTRENAEQIAATYNAQRKANQKNKLLFDYEHAMLTLKGKGVAVPAAGWGDAMVVKDDGLYAEPVSWTPKAAQMIADKEILYTSPVFSFDKQTGAVLGVQMCALTNDPALDGLPELQVALSTLITEGNQTMDKILEKLRWFLNLPVASTADDVFAELEKLKKQLKPEAQAAASFDLGAYLTQLQAESAQVAALSNQVTSLQTQNEPDPAKFVPIAALTAAHARIAELSAQTHTSNVETMIASALQEGRLLGSADADWARSFAGKHGEQELQAALSARQAIPALKGTQTNGLTPKGDATAVLTKEQAEAARLLGYSDEAFAKLD